MDEENFWILLEASRPKIGCVPDEQAKLMTDLLAKKDREQIIDFENIRLNVLHRLYIWPLLKANFIVLSYVSDDVFEDFRHWIILNGRENYEKTLANPNCLHEYIHGVVQLVSIVPLWSRSKIVIISDGHKASDGK